MQQAHDFNDENEALYELLAPLSDEELGRPTLFKDWTINDILQHLHFFNHMADLSLQSPDEFAKKYGEMVALREAGETMISSTDKLLNGIKGKALLDLWHDYYPQTAAAFAAADPKERVKWAGPDMSARSSISARLMETWAHALAIYDLLGATRVDTDRIKNIVVMGVNTFGWTFINRGEEVPEKVPYLKLAAPSGEVWKWNDPDPANCIEGTASDFCQVVTQCRNIGDTALKVTGETATTWMAKAQCFAGPPETPPAAGARHT